MLRQAENWEKGSTKKGSHMPSRSARKRRALQLRIAAIKAKAAAPAQPVSQTETHSASDTFNLANEVEFVGGVSDVPCEDEQSAEPTAEPTDVQPEVELYPGDGQSEVLSLEEEASDGAFVAFEPHQGSEVLVVEDEGSSDFQLTALDSDGGGEFDVSDLPGSGSALPVPGIESLQGEPRAGGEQDDEDEEEADDNDIHEVDDDEDDTYGVRQSLSRPSCSGINLLTGEELVSAGLSPGDFEDTREFEELDYIARQTEVAGSEEAVEGGVPIAADLLSRDADRQSTDEDAAPSPSSAGLVAAILGDSQETLVLESPGSSDEMVIVGQVGQEDGVIDPAPPIGSDIEEEPSPLLPLPSSVNPVHTGNTTTSTASAKRRAFRLNGPRLGIRLGSFEITLTLFQIERDPR